MNATVPPKPPIVLATPINVEESRAQRLQRQQARFRDRGGIFVPTNRSTLLDILLGKTSPLKKPRRSASASPSRANEEKSSFGNAVKPALRRSPRKQSQKILDIVTEEQPLAMTEDRGSEVGKPIKKAPSSKSSKSCPQKKAKVPPKKRTTKPSGGASIIDDSVDTPTEKASKRTIAASEKKSLKVSTKKIVPNVDHDSEDHVPLVKPKPKGKTLRKTKAPEADGAKGTSKTRGRKPATATTSAASPTRLERTKKVELVYSGDAACMPTNKAATKKVTGSQVEIDGAKPRLKHTKKAEYDSAYKPTKKPSTKKVLEDDVACKPVKKSTVTKLKSSAAPSMEMEQCESSSNRKGTGASNVDGRALCRVPDIREEDGEGDLGNEDTAPSKSTSNDAVTSKGKKRASASIAQDSDPQPRRKRIKSGTTETDMDPSLRKNLSDEAPLVTSKKRRRNPEDAESGVEDSVDMGTKRKKHSGPSESGQTPDITVKEDSVKPVAKRSSKTKVTKSTCKGRKQRFDNATIPSNRKENPRMSKSSKVASNSGPPKSVLQRIKDSLGAQVVDNEPDPIDFLS